MLYHCLAVSQINVSFRGITYRYAHHCRGKSRNVLFISNAVFRVQLKRLRNLNECVYEYNFKSLFDHCLAECCVLVVTSCLSAAT